MKIYLKMETKQNKTLLTLMYPTIQILMMIYKERLLHLWELIYQSP